MPTLRQKAIAAYESSDLAKRDALLRQELTNEIARFFHTVGVSAYVNNNPFTFEDLIFHATVQEDSDGVFGYQVDVFRECPTCKTYLELTVSKSDQHHEGYQSLSTAEFGGWLQQPHVCEFLARPRNPVKGFTGPR